MLLVSFVDRLSFEINKQSNYFWPMNNQLASHDSSSDVSLSNVRIDLIIIIMIKVYKMYAFISI